MDNGLSRYNESQKQKLAADIEKARKNGYIILLFEHVPLITKNPAEKMLNLYIKTAKVQEISATAQAVGPCRLTVTA